MFNSMSWAHSKQMGEILSLERQGYEDTTYSTLREDGTVSCSSIFH